MEQEISIRKTINDQYVELQAFLSQHPEFSEQYGIFRDMETKLVHAIRSPFRRKITKRAVRSYAVLKTLL
jgi:hypothetical protein